MFRDFKDRGRGEVKYSFSKEQARLKVDIPKNRLQRDNSLYKIAQYLE